ncbi:MAG: AMP-binding protein [Burkholderiales bacterium]|nr:AMP-binding protein [Anaerolineae bacterium]
MAALWPASKDDLHLKETRFRRVDIAGNRTLYGVFAEYAELQPQRKWLIFERPDGQVCRWTYAEFLSSIHQAANLLHSLGIAEGDVFNIHMPNHPAYPQLILAASLIGAIAMPSNPASTYAELRYLIEHSGAKVMFTDSDSWETAQKVANHTNVDLLVLCDADESETLNYERMLAQQPATPPPNMGTADKSLQILYTSGTTSRPKGVTMTNANFIYGAEAVRAGIGARPDDRHLIVLPLFHGAAQFHALWVALIAGGSAAIMPRFSASRYFEQAIAYDATLSALFGAPLRMLLNQPPRPSDAAHALRNITFAQNLTAAQYDEWHRRFKVPLQQLWGMTETVTVPIMSPVTGPRNLQAMGRPILGYEMKIVDENDHEVAAGEHGQLVVRGTAGRSLMRGYWNDPDATSKIMRESRDGIWLYTGDTVYIDTEGFIYFADRGKDMLKRAGERISSTEIESVVKRCAGVSDACVIGLPDPIRDETIVAVVIREDDCDLSSETVIAFCQGYLSPFKVPERVVFVEQFPRTSVGKIQKHLVRAQLLEGNTDLGLSLKHPH